MPTTPGQYVVAGVALGAMGVLAVEWVLFHFWPMDRTQDARDLARRKLKQSR